MTQLFRTLRIACALASLPLAIACGGTDPAAIAGDAPADPDAWDSADNVAECSLLKDPEVTQALGSHDPPQRDMLFGGCVWYGPTNSIGLRSQVIVAVVPKMVFDQVAEIGDPVDGFGPGATYASLYGELWFNCKGDMHCVLKLSLDPPEKRAAEARRLGLLVKSRV